MMRTMRSVAPWIMLIVALSFVGWMVFDVGMDVTGRNPVGVDDIVRVNGRKIDLQTYLQAVRNAQEQQRVQGGAALVTLEDQRALEDAVLEQLVQDILLDDEYRRRKISITDDEIRLALLNAPPPELLQVPDFQTDGEFDITKYQRYLRSGADPGFALALEARYRAELPRLKLLERLAEDVFVSDARLWRMYQDQHDSVTARVLAILPQAVVRDAEVQLTEDEIAAYYEEHADEFIRPARAILSYVEVSRRPHASDSAFALARAQAVRQEIVDGADFATVAARESADSATRATGGDLGEMGRGDLVASFEEAALALRPGQISQPVLTQFGYHIIQLESKRDDRYAARHILIPIELQGDHLDVVDMRADSLDLLAAEQDDPTVLDTAAADLGLPILRADPLFEGSQLRLGGVFVPTISLAAFELEPGQTSEVIESPQAYYLFRLDSILPAGVPSLDEVRVQLTRAARTARKWERARAIADDIAEAISGGESLARASIRYGVQPRTLDPFTRTNPSPVVADAPSAVGAAFGLPVGTAGGPYEAETAIFFVQPTERHTADSAAFAEQIDAMRNSVLQQIRQARLQLIMASIRQYASVVDRRREVLRAQQRAASTPIPGSPLGF